MTTKSSEIRRAFTACGSAFAATAVFSFFLNLLVLVVPLYMLQVFDRVLSSRSESTLVMLTVLAGFMLLILGFLEIVRARVLVRAGVKFEGLLKDRVFAAVFERSVGAPGSTRTQALQDLEKGSTTRREVLTAFGPPSQVISMEGETVLYYLYERSEGDGLILIVYNRMRVDTRYDRAIFFFDDNDILTEYATHITPVD